MFVFYRAAKRGDSYVDYFDKAEDAVEAAEREWDSMSAYDKDRTAAFWVGGNERNIPAEDEFDEYADEVDYTLVEYKVNGRYTR